MAGRLQILNHDHTVSTIDADNPLPVTTVPAGGGADVDAADLIPLTGYTAAVGVTTLVAAPGAGTRIVVNAIMVQNVSAVATTADVGAGGAAAFGALLQTQGASLSFSGEVGREWKLPANTALTVTLSAANNHKYNVRYYTEAA
jgi:hypothetical protein